MRWVNISVLCDGPPLLLFLHSLGSRRGLWVERSNSSTMTDAHPLGSTAPSFIALIYTTTGTGGFRNGTILPFVFYCNILMLLLSGLLRGIFHSPLQSLCLGMRKHSQEYSALPEGIFLFSQVGGKMLSLNFSYEHFKFTCGIRAL